MFMRSVVPANPYRRGRLSTVDLLVLNSLDKLIFISEILITCYEMSCLNEEVNCTELSPSVCVPWLYHCAKLPNQSKFTPFSIFVIQYQHQEPDLNP